MNELIKDLGLLINATPVSYTHLDVYKRQLHVRCGSVFLVMANQEREKQGLDNPVAHDTDMAIRVAVEAIRKLIKEDAE